LCSSSKSTSLTSRKWNSLTRSFSRRCISFSLPGDSKSTRRAESLPSWAKISAKASVTERIAQALLHLVEVTEVVVEARDEFGEGLAFDARAAG
jgi:hypothetical protein